ncbi:HpaA family protein [Persephonella sp.]
MRKFLIPLLTLIGIMVVSCAKPPQVVSLTPSAQDYSPYKVVEGKRSGKDTGLKSALLLPQGSIPSFSYGSEGNRNSLLLSRLGFTNSKIEYKTIHDFPENFKRNLAKSLESIMLNKGYKVTGPYKSMDEMTFKEKKVVDFVLIPVIELYPEIKDNGCKNTSPISVSALAPAVKKGEIYCSGEVGFKGQLSFELREPLTNEKIYIKGVDFSTDTEKYEVKVVYENPNDAGKAFLLARQAKMEAINNSLNKALNLAYNKFIDIFNKYMPEGEEAEDLKKQIKELKQLKRY